MDCLDNTLALLSGLTRARFDEEEEEEVPAVLLLLQHTSSNSPVPQSITVDEATTRAFSTGTSLTFVLHATFSVYASSVTLLTLLFS